MGFARPVIVRQNRACIMPVAILRTTPGPTHGPKRPTRKVHKILILLIFFTGVAWATLLECGLVDRAPGCCHGA